MVMAELLQQHKPGHDLFYGGTSGQQTVVGKNQGFLVTQARGDVLAFLRVKDDPSEVSERSRLGKVGPKLL